MFSVQHRPSEEEVIELCLPMSLILVFVERGSPPVVFDIIW